jgi:hypothetical protein
MANFYRTWYELQAIECHRTTVIYSLPTNGNENMAAARTSEVEKIILPFT